MVAPRVTCPAHLEAEGRECLLLGPSPPLAGVADQSVPADENVVELVSTQTGDRLGRLRVNPPASAPTTNRNGPPADPKGSAQEGNCVRRW